MRQRYCKKIETKKINSDLLSVLSECLKRCFFFNEQIKPFVSKRVRRLSRNDKIMNKYVVLLLVFLCVNLSGYAQGHERGSKRGNQQEMMKTIVSNLELDELQEVIFKEVMRKSMNERKSLREQDLSQEEKKDSLKSISDKENNELSKILNEDQYKEFLSLKSEMREKARQQRNGGGKKRN